MKTWLQDHTVDAAQFALQLRGFSPEILAKPRRAAALVQGIDPLGRGESSFHKDGKRGGVVGSFLSRRVHLVLRVSPADGDGPAEALLTVHTLRKPERVLRGVEVLAMRIMPQEVALLGIPAGGNSGLRAYMQQGALFVRMVHTHRSRYQLIQVGEHPVYGRMLFLNGETQIAASDEQLYSRALVRPAFGRRKGVERVCILGGGDCGVLREVLGYPVREVVMVDIDGEVVQAAAEFFPEVVGKSREDPRARIVLGDAVSFIRENGEFDLVIYDLSDAPLELTSHDELCGLIHEALAPGGRVAFQCGSDLPMFREQVRPIRRAVEKTFRKVKFRSEVIPSFADQPWGFVCGQKRAE